MCLLDVALYYTAEAEIERGLSTSSLLLMMMSKKRGCHQTHQTVSHTYFINGLHGRALEERDKDYVPGAYAHPLVLLGVDLQRAPRALLDDNAGWRRVNGGGC